MKQIFEYSALLNFSAKLFKKSTTLVCTSTLLLQDGNAIIRASDEIFNNVVCATSKAWDQPAHTRSLIRAFASRLSNL